MTSNRSRPVWRSGVLRQLGGDDRRRRHVLAPAAKTYVPAAVLARLDIHAAVEVDHVAERDLDKPAAQRGRWRVLEDTMTLAGPRKKDPVLTLRRVFVHSTVRAQAAVTARERRLDQARDDLERLQRGLGSRHYP